MDVIWQPKAIKQLRKVGDRVVRKSITDAVDELEVHDKIEQHRAFAPLVRHKYDCRIRVGDWRVLINKIAGNPVIASIEEVKKRDERTY